MSEFLAILALYYMCDATAVTRPMSMEEVQACTQTYDSVKTYFVPDFDLAPEGSLARFEQMTEAYVAFRAWQAANPDLVTEMRQDAWNTVRGVPATRS